MPRIKTTKSQEDGVKRKTRTMTTKSGTTVTRTKTKSKSGKTKSQSKSTTASSLKNGRVSSRTTTNYRTKSKKGKGSAAKSKGTKIVVNRRGMGDGFIGTTESGKSKSRASVTSKKLRSRY